MKKQWIILLIVMIIIFLLFIQYFQMNCNIPLKPNESLNPDECGGFIATGSVCINNRSMLLKNRHSDKPGTMKPFYYQGTNYSFIAFGTYSKEVGRPYCRMGINEKGLSIGNFDQSELISDGNWNYISDHISENEDYDMWYILGNFDTVKTAATWLVHHASYPCQWAIVSKEKGVGAIVAMDKEYHGNISWINNTYMALGNRLYCEQQFNAQMRRTQYLADQIYYHGIGIESTIPYAFSIKDIALILAKDINASNNQYPWLQEPASGIYSGYYIIGQTGSICPTSSTSCMLAVSGDDKYNDSTNLVFFTSGYNPHIGLFVPISASYLKDQDDIPLVFRTEIGIQQFTNVAQSYAENIPGYYNRSRTHYIHNTTDKLESEMIESYEAIVNLIPINESYTNVQHIIQSYCYNQTYNALSQYRDLFIKSITLIIPNESYVCGNVQYVFNKTLPFYPFEHTSDVLILNSTVCKIDAFEPLNITITYLNENTQITKDDELLMEWYSTPAGRHVIFNYSGFKPYCFYKIIHNNQTTIIQSTSKGHILYFSVLEKENHFQIQTVNYTDKSPTADFTFTPSNPIEGERVSFNASMSYDDGNDIQYYWDLNDDHIVDQQGKKIHHEFTTAGTYYVNLTIKDTSNQSDWIVRAIVIQKPSNSKKSGSDSSNLPEYNINTPPKCICSMEPLHVSINETILFNASESYDPDGTIVSYYWDFGDSHNEEGKICNHTFMKDGRYMVILTVIDDDGAMDTNTTYIMVHQQNLPPSQLIIQGETCLEINVSYPFFFHAIDVDDDFLNLTVDWGDGTRDSTCILNNITFPLNHSWQKSGEYIIKAHVSDEFKSLSESVEYKLIAGEIVCKIDAEIKGYILKLTSEPRSLIFYDNETKIHYDVKEKNNGTYIIDYENDDSWKYGIASNGIVYLNIQFEQKETSAIEFKWVILCGLIASLCYFFMIKKMIKK